LDSVFIQEGLVRLVKAPKPENVERCAFTFHEKPASESALESFFVRYSSIKSLPYAMATQIPTELFLDFARALKRMGLDKTLLKLLLSSKTMFDLCKPELFRELDIAPVLYSGIEPWKALLGGQTATLSRHVRALPFRTPILGSPLLFEGWASLLERLVTRCKRLNELELNLMLGKFESAPCLGVNGHAGLPTSLRRISISATHAMEMEAFLEALETLLHAPTARFESWSYNGCLVDFSRFPLSSAVLKHLTLDMSVGNTVRVSTPKPLEATGLEAVFRNLRTFSASAKQADWTYLLGLIETAPRLQSWTLADSSGALPDFSPFPVALSKLNWVHLPSSPASHPELFGNPAFKKKTLTVSCGKFDEGIISWLGQAGDIEKLTVLLRNMPDGKSLLADLRSLMDTRFSENLKELRIETRILGNLATVPSQSFDDVFRLSTTVDKMSIRITEVFISMFMFAGGLSSVSTTTEWTLRRDCAPTPPRKLKTRRI